MLFQDEHIEQIRTGEKTATRRDWASKQAVEGNVYMATTEMFQSHEECDCYVRVTDLTQQRLGDMTEADAQKEGGYTLQEFREVWREINGEWDPDQVVWVVEFDYAGEEPVIYAQSPVTEQYYKVTEWEYHGDGKYVAESKEPVEREAVPAYWLERLDASEVTA